MLSKDILFSKTLLELLAEYPYAGDFFSAMALPALSPGQKSLTFHNYLQTLDGDVLEDMGIDRDELGQRFRLFMTRMAEVADGIPFQVDSVTILGGRDKSGRKEDYDLTLHKGEITCVVGPTDSGKSRLLADIEWMAQGDTPTGRHILINQNPPPKEWRFSLEHKLVAQLSQNMNFVVDMTVWDFIKMHAESRLASRPDEKTAIIIEEANLLAGETFSSHTPVTSLSGGQSRALMIADTAFLSTSPIVLIDEIENAGIDRKKALNLLIQKEKIILMATHDPILALLGDRRIVIANGGINAVLATSPQEKENLAVLEELDRKMTDLRNLIRSGKRIESIILPAL